MTSPYLRRRLRSLDEVRAEALRLAPDYERKDAPAERPRETAEEPREAEPPRS
jgi:hypothetical protein